MSLKYLVISLFVPCVALAAEPTAGGLGTLSDGRQIIPRHRSEAVGCYATALKAKPTLQGRVMLSFQIDADGLVVNATAKPDTLDDSAVLACLVRVARTWRFLRPPDGKLIDISYPFAFKPEDVTPATTALVGGLTKDEVGRLIKRHWTEVKACYERALSRDPSLAGKMMLSFQIDGAGRVMNAAAKPETLRDVDVLDCIERAAATWKFPPPRGGGPVDVNYPFNFEQR